SLKTALRSASSSSATILTAARTSPPRRGAPERRSSASWVRARSARRTWRSSPLSMTSWPRATILTSNSDSSVRRLSSLRPSRPPRSTSGASERRRVIWVASLKCRRFPYPSLSRGLRRLRGEVQLDVQLAQPRGWHLAGRLHQQILGLLVHRDRDDLADVGLAGQHHHDAIDTGRRAPVRRSAVLEGVQHPAEAGLDVVLGVPADAEGLVHDVRPVVADGAAGQLHAVADDVVLVGLDRQRILALQRLQAALRHRERVVAEVDLAGLLVPLEHREVDDPAEVVRVLLQQLEVLAELDARLAGQFVGGRALVAHEEHGVAVDRAG